MTEDAPEAQLSQRNLTLIITSAVVVLLFCCCALAVVLWFTGDSILEFLGLAHGYWVWIG